MKKKFRYSLWYAMLSVLLFMGTLAGCSSDDGDPYVLQKTDIRIDEPEGGFTAKTGDLFSIEVKSVSDEGVSYSWLMERETVSQDKNFEYRFLSEGKYGIRLRAVQGELAFEYPFTVTVTKNGTQPPEGPSAYITKVLDFMPAVGQFTNDMPRYEDGDTRETMNKKVLGIIGNNNGGMISLGGFGGYVIVGFDHTIENVAGKRDFRVKGNAFYSNPDPDAPEGGSCEPGIIMVAYDANGNGIPDEDEWYEIAGSAHEDPALEPWYARAVAAGNDMRTYFNYEITYFKPEREPESDEEKARYIRWEDNLGNSGYKTKNPYHDQPYYPQWAEGGSLTFRGTCLPQNGIDESWESSYYVLYKFRYGYADNALNTEDESAIDIDWAVDGNGRKVHLPGVDFIKVYTGINQENGWIGECSTEITGIEDLHILGVEIDTRK